MRRIEMDDTNKFSQMEEAILDYLYAHPDGEIGTPGLMRILKPEQDTDEQRQEAYKETQYAIETLLAAGLAKGERHSGYGDVYHSELRLTPKGEAEAIKQRRRPKKAIVESHIPRPETDK